MEKIEDENGFHLIRSASLDWISKNAWRQSQYISWKLPSFQQLCLSLLTQSHLWEQFLQHQDPYHFMEIALTQDQDETSFNWNELTSFEKYILFMVLCISFVYALVRKIFFSLLEYSTDVCC